MFAVVLSYNVRRRDLLYFPLGSLVLAFLCGQHRAILLGFSHLMKLMVLSAPLSILLVLSAILKHESNRVEVSEEKGKLDKTSR